MTPEIKEKIHAVSKHYDDTCSIMNARDVHFRAGAEYGYTLAQPEIKALNREVERLNTLIKDMWYHNKPLGFDHMFDEETKAYWFNQFVKRNNLLPTPPNNKS